MQMICNESKILFPCCGVEEPRGLTTTGTLAVQPLLRTYQRSRSPFLPIGRRGIGTSAIEPCSRRRREEQRTQLFKQGRLTSKGAWAHDALTPEVSFSLRCLIRQIGRSELNHPLIGDDPR
jgi:hypothetical protein